MAKIKLTLKQGLMVIDENCSRQTQALNGLESFAGSQVRTNQKSRGTIEQFHGQLSVMAKDLNLEWRIQSIEDDLARLQRNARTGDVATIGKELHALQQNPLWHDVQVAIVEMRQLKATTQAQNEELKTSISALQSQLSNDPSTRDHRYTKIGSSKTTSKSKARTKK